MNNHPDLKLCPLCPSGGDPYLDTWDKETESRHVKCRECGMQTGPFFRGIDAVASWNTRHDPVNENLKKILKRYANYVDEYEDQVDDLQEEIRNQDILFKEIAEFTTDFYKEKINKLSSDKEKLVEALEKCEKGFSDLYDKARISSPILVSVHANEYYKYVKEALAFIEEEKNE